MSMRVLLSILASPIAFSAGMLTALAARAEVPTEAQVKAAYVLNFAKFTEWPSTAFPNASTPLQVCVAGNADTLAGFGAIKGKIVQGREVQVRHMPKPAEAQWAGCSIVYLDPSQRTSIPGTLKSLAGLPVLTVSDVDNFVDSGGMLGLLLVDGRVRFDANRESVRANGLQLRAQLLTLARSVR